MNTTDNHFNEAIKNFFSGKENQEEVTESMCSVVEDYSFQQLFASAYESVKKSNPTLSDYKVSQASFGHFMDILEYLEENIQGFPGYTVNGRLLLGPLVALLHLQGFVVYQLSDKDIIDYSIGKHLFVKEDTVIYVTYTGAATISNVYAYGHYAPIDMFDSLLLQAEEPEILNVGYEQVHKHMTEDLGVECFKRLGITVSHNSTIDEKDNRTTLHQLKNKLLVIITLSVDKEDITLLVDVFKNKGQTPPENFHTELITLVDKHASQFTNHGISGTVNYTRDSAACALGRLLASRIEDRAMMMAKRKFETRGFFRKLLDSIIDISITDIKYFLSTSKPDLSIRKKD